MPRDPMGFDSPSEEARHATGAGKAGSSSDAPAAKPKRKHRATGKPRGGKRPGAGRPTGARNALPQGAVAAIRALRHRVPEGTPEPLAELADEALATVAEVMRGQVRRGTERLNAARVVREEICGPVPKQLRVGGEGGGPITIHVDRDEE